MVLISTGMDTVGDIFNWSQLVTSGGFAALVWYLISRHLPKVQDDFSKELKAERDARISERADFMRRLNEQETHCAQERKEAWNEVLRLRIPIAELSKQVENLSEVINVKPR